MLVKLKIVTHIIMVHFIQKTIIITQGSSVMAILKVLENFRAMVILMKEVYFQENLMELGNLYQIANSGLVSLNKMSLLKANI